MAAQHIVDHLQRHDLGVADVRRWCLHEANIDLMIRKKLLVRNASADEAPIVLGRYANTASAGDSRMEGNQTNKSLGLVPIVVEWFWYQIM